MSRFQPETVEALEGAGWLPGRDVDIAEWEAALVADGFPAFGTAARRFLAEFGGLVVHDGGSGVTRARSPFTLRATACLGEADCFSEWAVDLGRPIDPIGELDGGTCARQYLGIDEHDELYCLLDDLRTFGRMPHAMDRLVLGHMPHDVL